MTTAVAPVKEVSLVQETGYQLVALDAAELKTGHAKMVEWARGQQLLCDKEKAEEEDFLRIATERKWSVAPFKKRIQMLTRRRVFYEKIEIALNAGYVIVPNFEMTVFAIRTTATKPTGQAIETTWTRSFPQQPQMLSAGEGEYKDPIPHTVSKNITVPDGKGGIKTETWKSPAENFDEVSFPIALAKPVLMNATSEALAARVFDEVGVAVDTRWRGARRGDPIILGRLRNPAPRRSDMTFFIGWYFDPSRV